MFTFKTLDTDSVALLCELSVETFVQAYADVHSEENLKHYCQEFYNEDVVSALLSSKKTKAVVAYEGNQAAGFYVIKHRDCPVELGAPATELKLLYVLASYYGSGLGRDLLNRVAGDARNLSSKWLWLCVSDRNFRAQAFYAKNRFEKVGDGPKLVVGNDTLSSSIMALSLEG